MFETFNKKTASTQDKVAWILCQIIDDDAPIRWTRYRGIGAFIASNKELMDLLSTLSKE